MRGRHCRDGGGKWSQESSGIPANPLESQDLRTNFFLNSVFYPMDTLEQRFFWMAPLRLYQGHFCSFARQSSHSNTQRVGSQLGLMAPQPGFTVMTTVLDLKVAPFLTYHISLPDVWLCFRSHHKTYFPLSFIFNLPPLQTQFSTSSFEKFYVICQIF